MNVGKKGSESSVPQVAGKTASVGKGAKKAVSQAAQQVAKQAKKVPLPPKPLSYRVVKRAFDIVFSTLVIVVGFVPSLGLSVVLALGTKGSPIYTQERIGKGGKRFNIIKFRTMVVDADDLAKHLTPEQMKEWVTEHKVTEDPRVTRMGRFLRRTSIDEFPNFLNVLAGQMSVVGPRAITEKELHWFGDDLEKMLSVPAGITGWWQVSSRNEATFKSGERQKLELYYVDNACLSLDARIIFRTLGAMFEGTGR